MGPSLNLKGEGGDLSNERKAITFQGVIIRLSYQMCDSPFLRLKRLSNMVTPGTNKYQGDPRFKNCVVQEENSPLFQWVMSQTPEQFDDAKCKKSD